MVLLQVLHSTVAITSGGDALHGVVGTGEGRDVRHLVLDASRPWLRFGHTKMRAFLCDTHLAHRKPNVATGRLRTGMTEARMFLQLLADFDSLFRQVNLVGEADQHGIFVREKGTCGSQR